MLTEDTIVDQYKQVKFNCRKPTEENLHGPSEDGNHALAFETC